MSKRAFYVRQFLNTEEDGGTAFIEFEVREVEHYDKASSVDVTFKVADCNRIVNLDFGVYVSDGDDVEHKRVKLRRLVRAVNGFAKALNAALDEIEAR